MASDTAPQEVGQLLDSPELAGALESDRFKQFLDQVPVAIAVSELRPTERIVYANEAFERLTGEASRELVGGKWDRVPGHRANRENPQALGEVITLEGDYVGAFVLSRQGAPIKLDAWSNLIEDADGAPAFRLVALVEVAAPDGS
ncbi:MAG TPA: PAS domain-containing protein, partial [Phenylobacterium sp.]